MYVNREVELEKYGKKYDLVRGQCSHSVKAVLKRDDNYDEVRTFAGRRDLACRELLSTEVPFCKFG